MKQALYLLFWATIALGQGQTFRTGLVETPDGLNKALIVGVSHGLPGIELDVKMMKNIAENQAYNYTATILEEDQATVANIAHSLSYLAAQAGEKGSLMFYFSGHGNSGTIYPQDRTMAITEIRDAIALGRLESGPLERLILIFDSCYSGSLLDPVFFPSTKLNMIDIMNALLSVRTEGYWKKLIVLASSEKDETSQASSLGSIFTLALTKAFQEVFEKAGTVGEFIQKTKDYTKGHHPVERLVPLSLAQESLY